MVPSKIRRATAGTSLGVVAAILLACFTMISFTGRADAVTLQSLTIQQLADHSQSVLVARTVSTSARLVSTSDAGGRGTVQTVVELEVQEVLKGAPAVRSTVVLPGGSAGGFTLSVDSQPVFSAGETSLLFLDGLGRIVGGPQGKLQIVNGYVPALNASLAIVRSMVEGTYAAPAAEVRKADELDEAVRSNDLNGAYPQITAITPKSASAGTNTHVPIQGSGFGDHQSGGSVNFFYQEGQPSIPGQVVSWSDTSIVCSVPIGVVNGYSGSAGSGPVTVTAASGQTSAGFDFQVTFADSGMRWVSSGMSYRINPNCDDTPNEQAMVDAAAKTWNAVSKFKFSDVGTCGTTSTPTADGHNDVFWSATEVAYGIAAVTARWYATDNPSRVIEADICFNDGAGMQWGDGTLGTIDVQGVALHEMGHCEGLLDLYGPKDRGKVMYGTGEGTSGPSRSLSADDIAGAVHIWGGGTGGGGSDEGGGEPAVVYMDDTTLFSDVKAANPYFAAITTLAGNGIVTGFPDGSFRPNSTVTRQQFAKMVVKALGLAVTGRETCPFTDVLPQSGSDALYPAKYVAVCEANGITSGKTDTSFAPNDSITRQQLISMVVRAVDLATPPDTYQSGFSPGQFSVEEHYVNACKAAYVGLLNGLVNERADYDFQKPATRAECAQLLSVMRREQPVTGARVLYADDFSVNRIGWPEYQWPDWRWLIGEDQGSYACSIDTPATLSVSYLPQTWPDCTVGVDARSSSASVEVKYGVVFRVSSDQSAFYGFTVSSMGYWELWRRTGGMWGKEESLLKKTSLLISKGKGCNNVRVTVDGSQVLLAVNGAVVGSYDGLEGAPGLMGLVCESPSTSGEITATFDNLKIWSLH